MATNTNQQTTGAAQETVDRTRELNERIIESARAAGGAYLDAYERSLQAIVDYQKALASATPVDWLKHALDAQADFTRELGELYASASRETLKRN